MRRSLGLVLVVLAGAGCVSRGAFVCAADGECVAGGRAGSCVMGFCAFDDATCPSGQRYGEYAGGGLAGACVGGAGGPDGANPGPDGAGPDGADPTGCGVAPANGVDLDLLTGVTASLDVAAGVTASVHSDTGEITGGPSRPAGEGVQAGIGFRVLGPGLSVLAVDALNLGAGSRLRVRGVNALVILSRRDVQIAGVIDVSAGLCPNGAASRHCAGPGGGDGGRSAGADARGCAPGERGDDVDDTGGGGGGFAEDGADGGEPQAGGRGGIATAPPCAPATLAPLGGGSGGGAGGGGEPTTDLGGGGGGAVQISSCARIQIGGPGAGVDAAGEGGSGGSSLAGGSGGGSGGAILLEARDLLLENATLAANGGGGGAGSEGSLAEAGARGGFSAAAALGGGGGPDGGDGGAGTLAPTEGVKLADSSGGGGGARGVIRLNATSVTATGSTISPPETRGAP